MLLQRFPWDADAPWKEDDLQAAVVQTLRQMSVLFAADQNEGKRSLRDGARRKALGMAAGEPDLRIYMDGARCGFIEMKRKDGRLSPDQRDRLAALDALGFPTAVVKAATPADAVEKVKRVLAGWGVPAALRETQHLV